MKKTALALTVVALGFLANDALAQESPWLVRVRAVDLDPANHSDPVGGVGPADTLHVDNKTIPDVNISYFFTANWATELVLTYPQKQEVSLNGQNIGSFKHLPPTLTLQYHFLPQAQLNPYLGAGLNYTRISNVDLLNGAATLDKDSRGLALQAGVDYRLNKNWSLNFDV
jgi:outer membrane protein